MGVTNEDDGTEIITVKWKRYIDTVVEKLIEENDKIGPSSQRNYFVLELMKKLI